MAPEPDPVPPPSPVVSLSPSSSAARLAVAAGSSAVVDSSSDDGESGYDVSDSHDAYELQDFGGGQAARADGGVCAPAAGSATSRRTSGSTAASFQLYTPDEEQAVVRQFDRRLVLFLALCYLLSFLDRSNIGNARVAGMEDDLQTRPARDGWYEWSLTSFYVAYIAFEWMSLLWRIIPAHVYVSLILLSWGVTASLQAVAVSYPMLVFLRFLLGIGEAGFTGVPFFLSFFYKRNELAYRTAMFVAAAPLATTFASSLAWLILKLGEAVPIAPWRLLFLLEGFPSVLVAVVAWGAVVDSPQTAHYLSPRLRKVARLRLRHERQASPGSNGNSDNKSNKTRGRALKEALSVLADPKAWLPAIMFFLTNMAYSSLPVFLPTILREMGHSALESQALSAPPYLMAFLSVLATAHVSDRAGSRTPYIVAFALASAAGYLVLALARPLAIGPMWRYLAVYPAAVGFFNVVVLLIAWSINNQPSADRRGGGFVLLQVVGQCGPLVGTRLYPQRDGPYFEAGMWTCAGCMAGAAVVAVVLRFLLARHNRGLDAADAGPDAEEARGLVDSARDGRKTGAEPFRYML